MSNATRWLTSQVPSGTADSALADEPLQRGKNRATTSASRRIVQLPRCLRRPWSVDESRSASATGHTNDSAGPTGYCHRLDRTGVTNDGAQHPPAPSGVRRRGVRRRHHAADLARRGRGDRGRHGSLRRAGVPRPAADRRTADSRSRCNFGELEHTRGNAITKAGGDAARSGVRRCVQPRQGPPAAGARQPAAAVRARQPAVAFRQFVPRGAGDVFAAVGPHRGGQGRRHGIRRHARRLRCAG